MGTVGQNVYLSIERYFHENAIPYREIQHAPGARTEDYHQAVGCRYEQQAKCLFLKVINAGETAYVICAIPASKKANFKALRDLLKAKDVKFASREELVTVTGCDLGELAPVGRLFGIQTLMDADLLREDEIFINAGRLDVSFAFNPADLARVEQPVVFERAATTNT